MRRQVVSHRHVDGGQQLQLLQRPELRRLDLDILVEMRLQRLPDEAVEADDLGAGVRRARLAQPRDDRAAAVGGDAHEVAGADAHDAHQIGVELDRQLRAQRLLVGEVVDVGVRMAAVGMRMSVVAHLTS